MMPWIITFAVFWLYPLAYAAFLSFTKYSTLTDTGEFIGFRNYEMIFADKLFWKALGNTFFFTMGTVPLTTALAIFFAVLINSRLIKRKDFFRSTFFIPSVTSLIVVALIFSNLYARDGYINAIMSMLNLPYPESGWLLNPDTALLSVMAMDVWMATGYYMILFLSGMQTIPEDLYESAKLSGANAWQQFRRITLPLLKPTLLFVVIINTIKSFQVFIEIFVMTKGGPLNSTMTLVYMVYVNAFEKTDMMGYASALAYIVFILLLILSFIQAKLLKFDRN
ncbi:MAG: carbohydrate ABC transporter permease [Candidatus Kapaibacterium sp.]